MAKKKTNEEEDQTPNAELETAVHEEMTPAIKDEMEDPNNPGSMISISALVGMLDEMAEGMEVTSAYYEFPMGEPVKCFYVGDTTMKSSRKDDQGNQKDVPAVRILLPDGTFAITASAVVVSTFKQYNKMKAFSVTRVGEQKGPNGTYFTYKIFELVN